MRDFFPENLLARLQDLNALINDNGMDNNNSVNGMWNGNVVLAAVSMVWAWWTLVWRAELC